MAAAEPDSDSSYEDDPEEDDKTANSDSSYEDDLEEDDKTTDYYLKRGQEYNYGSKMGVKVMKTGGRFDFFSRFGGPPSYLRPIGVAAAGPEIEEKIQELLGNEVLKDYNTTLDELVIYPDSPELHERLKDILTQVLEHRPQGNIPPHFNNYIAKIIKDEDQWDKHSEYDYYMVDPEKRRRKAATTIQKTARKFGASEKLKRIKTRKQVREVMLKGQEGKNTRIVGAKHVSDLVGSYLTGHARGGTKKKRRKRRKKSKKKRQKKRTKRKLH